MISTTTGFGLLREQVHVRQDNIIWPILLPLFLFSLVGVNKHILSWTVTKTYIAANKQHQTEVTATTG